MSTEQAENLDAILRQSAFPADLDVSELRRRLAELTSAQPLPAGVTVTPAALGGVPTAEITIDGTEPRHVILYFHGGVYVLGDAVQAVGLAAQVGRRTRATVISVDYRLAPEHPYPAAVDDALAAYQALRRSPTRRRARARPQSWPATSSSPARALATPPPPQRPRPRMHRACWLACWTETVGSCPRPRPGSRPSPPLITSPSDPVASYRMSWHLAGPVRPDAGNTALWSQPCACEAGPISLEKWVIEEVFT